MTAHTYHSLLAWQGSTGVGYDHYPRSHRVTTPPAAGDLALSADAAFRGDPTRMNPEQLLLAAASSCQLLAYLALTARARVDVLAYDDEAEAVMPADADPMRITQITLRPRIQLAAGADHERARRLVDRAHNECFVANSLRADVQVEPMIVAAEES